MPLKASRSSAGSDALGVLKDRRERILSDVGQQFQMCMEK